MSLPEPELQKPGVEGLRKPVNQRWLADQFSKQEERRCYVCNGRDDGGCHGIDGERAECPWY